MFINFMSELPLQCTPSDYTDETTKQNLNLKSVAEIHVKYPANGSKERCICRVLSFRVGPPAPDGCYCTCTITAAAGQRNTHTSTLAASGTLNDISLLLGTNWQT